MQRITTESGAVYLVKREEGLIKRIGPSEDVALVRYPNNVWNPFVQLDGLEVGRAFTLYWEDSILGQRSTRVVSIEEVEDEG